MTGKLKQRECTLSVIYLVVFDVQYNSKAEFCHHAHRCSKKKSKVTRYPDFEQTLRLKGQTHDFGARDLILDFVAV